MSQTEALILFNIFVAAMLALDLGVFQRKAHGVSFREAAIWSAFWVAISLGVQRLGVGFWYGSKLVSNFSRRTVPKNPSPWITWRSSR